MTFRFKSNVVRLFVTVVLLSSLACSELPELGRLIDDTSNDFTPASYVLGEIASDVAVQATPATESASRVTSRQTFLDMPQHNSAFRGPRSLLLLYSILKT